MPVAVPGAPPEFPQCDPLSPSSVTVSWKPPPVEESNGLILGYTLTYRLENKIGGELTLALYLVVLCSAPSVPQPVFTY